MGDERAVFIVHREVKTYQVDVDFEGLERLRLIFLIGVTRRTLRRRIGRWRNLRRGMQGCGAQQDSP
jgi:hypothetical protein